MQATAWCRAGWPPPTTSATTWSGATGPAANTFLDDRVDIFPPPSSGTTTSSSAGGQGWQAVLARYRFTAVLWPRSEPLASLVAEDPAWSVRILDRHWVVAVRARHHGLAPAPPATR